jgi:multidrug resistance efflux pump
MGVWILAVGVVLITLVFLSLTRHIVNDVVKAKAEIKTLTARVDGLEKRET